MLTQEQIDSIADEVGLTPQSQPVKQSRRERLAQPADMSLSPTSEETTPTLISDTGGPLISASIGLDVGKSNIGGKQPRSARIAEEVKSEEDLAADTKSADMYSPIMPSKEGEGVLATAGKAAVNVPSSAFNMLKTIYETIRHPINTGTGIKRTIVGAGKEMGQDMLKDVIGQEGADQVMQEHPSDINDATFDQFKTAMAERYGGADELERSFTNDPVGIITDFISLAGAGKGLLKKVPGVAKAVEAVDDLTAGTRAKVGSYVSEGAEKQLEKVLSPTKQSMKQLTQDVLPELATRKKFAWTRKGLQEKYANELEKSGQAIDEAWKALPPDSIEKIQPVVDAIEKTKSKFTVDGTIVEPAAWKAADDLQKIILDVSKGGDTLSSESLRKVRQIWDKSIAKGGGFTADLAEQSKIAVTKEATDAIRKVLADSHPDIAALNKEYTFWSKVNDIMNETAKRKTGQSGGVGKLMSAGFGFSGGSAASGLKTGAIVAGGIAAAIAIVKSAAWKTFSSSMRMRVAEAIAKGDTSLLETIANSTLGTKAKEQIESARQEAEAQINSFED